MRTEPTAKALRNNKIDPAVQVKINSVTRIVAIIVAFLSTFFLMFKIMFL